MDQATEAVIAKAAMDYAAEFVKSLAKGGHALFATKVLSHLKDFELYLSSTYQRCASVKLIVDRSQIHRLEDIYVKARYKIGNDKISDDELCQLVRENKRTVVLGFGGVGKTIFMKYLWLSIFSEPGGRIPVFVELKRLNEHKDTQLEAYVRRSLSPSGRAITDKEFDTLAVSGRFVFVFDAFDELGEEVREAVEGQVLELATKYPRCGLVVSSRQDDRFQSWEAFSVARALPFDRKQIEEVISKIQFDQKVKSKFRTDILGNKYAKYQSFLESPLLAIMMLMTFDQFADVPDKVHIFYRYAFYTLYTLHDAGKEAFRRERKSGLDEDQYKQIFSIFCLSTYLGEKTSFDISSLKSEIQRAAKHANTKVSVDDFISESCESVNLLYREGDTFSFVHRSFQEYFTAFAITNYFPKDVLRLVDGVRNSQSDSVFGMAYDMNSNLLDEEYILPKFEEFGRIVANNTAGGADWWTTAVAMGIEILMFKAKGGKRHTRGMQQIVATSRLADFVSRVAALLGEGFGVSYSRGALYEDSSQQFFNLMDAVMRELKAKNGSPKSSEVPRVVVVGCGRTEGSTAPIKENFMGDDERVKTLIEARPVVHKQLNSFVEHQRQGLIALERAVKGIRQRVRTRSNTLDELLTTESNV